MPEYINCSSCSEEITEDSDYCPHCGIIFRETENSVCERHAPRQASGVCIICHKVMCPECCVKRQNKVFCSEHAEIEVQQDWALVYQSTEISESELIKSILESSDIRCSDRILTRLALSGTAAVTLLFPEAISINRQKSLYRFRNILKRSPQSKNGRAGNLLCDTLRRSPPSQGV